MELSLDDVNLEDRGVLAPCGIVCMGCDLQQNESLEAAKAVVRIWEGFDMAGVGTFLFGSGRKEIQEVLRVLKTFIKVREQSGPCQGCFLAVCRT